MPVLEIDQESIDFIVAQEVTSPKYYERHYRKPEWPGEASGITVACGYDLGYATPDKIRQDWGNRVTPEMLSVMVSCAGVRGEAARALLPRVRNKIDIPWKDAYDVFLTRDIPQWTLAIKRVLPNCDKISALCLGMHVSTGYNRGVGGYTSTNPRYRELYNIRGHMTAQRFSAIGQEFRSMRRLWPNTKGLQSRYTQTADLWDKGLRQPMVGKKITVEVEHDPTVPLNAGPARTKPPATSTAQNTTTGGLVTASVGTAAHAANSGVPLSQVFALLVAGLVLAGVVWFAWYKNRNPS